MIVVGGKKGCLASKKTKNPPAPSDRGPLVRNLDSAPLQAQSTFDQRLASPKFNMSPEKRTMFEMNVHLPTIIFEGDMLVFTGVVIAKLWSFRIISPLSCAAPLATVMATSKDSKQLSCSWRKINNPKEYPIPQQQRHDGSFSAHRRCMGETCQQLIQPLTPEQDWETNVKKSWRNPPPNLFWNNCHLGDKSGTLAKRETLVEPSTEPFGSPRGKCPREPERVRKQFCPATFTMAEENKAIAVGEKWLLSKHPINKFQLCWLRQLYVYSSFENHVFIYVSVYTVFFLYKCEDSNHHDYFALLCWQLPTCSTLGASGGNQMPLCCKAITPLRRCSPRSNNQTPRVSLNGYESLSRKNKNCITTYLHPQNS